MTPSKFASVSATAPHPDPPRPLRYRRPARLSWRRHLRGFECDSSSRLTSVASASTPGIRYGFSKGRLVGILIIVLVVFTLLLPGFAMNTYVGLYISR